jgi:hypothetical protein
LGLRVITFIGESICTYANAFPEKTDFLTTKSVEVSGKSVAPATNAAFNFAATRGARAFPF